MMFFRKGRVPFQSLLLLAACFCLPAAARAGSIAKEPADTVLTFRQKAKRTGNILYRFIKSFDDYDTTYIAPQYYNYAAMIQNTNSYQFYRLAATDKGGRRQIISMSPAYSFKIGPYFGWRYIFLGYTFDVLHPKASRRKSEFNLSLYSAMLGCDLVYIKNNGDFKLQKTSGFDGVERDEFKGAKFDGLETYTASISAYYVFNHRRFSYPAAFSQSTVQRKSCGSWMLGLRYDHQKMRFDYTRLPQKLIGVPGNETIIDELKWEKIDYYAYSLTIGYAYNWVFAHNWLLGASIAPAIGYKRGKGERLRGDEVLISMKNLNFDFISRFGIVWNNTHWYAGLSLVSHWYDYHRDRLSLMNGANFLNLYVGFNFNRKRQYRR